MLRDVDRRAPDRARSARSRGATVALVLAGLFASFGRAHAEPEVRIVATHEGPPWSLPAPDLRRASPPAEVVAYEAYGDATAGLVAACVEVSASAGWVDEAEPIVFERLAGLATSTLLRARGAPPRWEETPARPTLPHTRRHELRARDGDTSEASLFLGFRGERGAIGVGCFAVSFGEGFAARATRFEGPFVAEPAPSLPLRGVVGSAKNPRETTLVMVVVATLAGALYVRRRPRPKVT